MDHQQAVEMCDQIVEHASQIAQLLSSDHCRESEISMANASVSLRDSLVDLRDFLQEAVQIPSFPIEDLRSGFISVASTYTRIQEKRYGKNGWGEATEEGDLLIEGVNMLLLYQARVHAELLDQDLEVSKHQLQLAIDRRRVNSDKKDDSPIIESPEEHAKRTAKESLKKAICELVKDAQNSGKTSYWDDIRTVLRKKLHEQLKLVARKSDAVEDSGYPSVTTMKRWAGG